MSRKDRKFKGFFRQKSGDLQKKKKKERFSPKFRVFFGRNPKFKGFFRQKLGDLQKKKKRSSPKFRAIFLPKFRKFKRLRGGSFRMGGAIFHFLQKIGLKSTKNMRFYILHKPMGGLEPPPAPPWLRYWVGVRCRLVWKSPLFLSGFHTVQPIFY